MRETATILIFPGSTYTYTMSYSEFYSFLIFTFIGVNTCLVLLGRGLVSLFRRRRK